MAQKKKDKLNSKSFLLSKWNGFKRWIKNKKQIKWKKEFTLILPIVLAVFGTGLLVTTHSYDTIYRTVSYKKETTDAHTFAAFKNGIIRYNKDGVAFLNRKNEEQWIHSSQFGTPILDVGEDAFAIADVGGNAIQVFTESGLKGEIETKLPIEKLSVSGQGIVSVILKSEMASVIVTYDSTGNVLAENQINALSIGYPTAIELSPDGTMLAVAYLDVHSTALKTKVICYNFGTTGEKNKNYEASVEEYEDAYIPELYYMGDSTLVAVSDSSFIIYEGKEKPTKKKEITIDQRIKSVFHSDKYIGFILLNESKSGYEARLYNKNGGQVMNRSFEGEYANVQMQDDEIIMYTGSHCCILTKTGLVKFEGDLKADALLVLETKGLNKYLVMSANELRTVHLIK